MLEPTRKIYSVHQATAMVKNAIASHLPGQMAVSGEITNFKRHHSGHCYFSLKDQKSQLPCVMWKSNFARLKFQMENGLSVVATGYIDVYAPHGKYQFYAELMEPAGLGSMELAFQQVYQKLQSQGLFEDAHKKPLPKYPRRIGIITSESGAAVKDIRDSIRSRWPCAKLYLFPAAVQGPAAAGQIAKRIGQLRRANRYFNLDLLIVGRGGGSREDLWAFNEEQLAQAIYDCDIPIISAVGHEVDVSIADLVADARASTPTKAGVTAVPDVAEVLDQLGYWQDRLDTQMRQTLRQYQGHLREVLASSAFRHPYLTVRHRQQQIDLLSGKLAEAAGSTLAQTRQKLHNMYLAIGKIEPHRMLANKVVQLDRVNARLGQAVRFSVSGTGQKLDSIDARLQRLQPGRLVQTKTAQLDRVADRTASAMARLLSDRRMTLTAQENRLAGLNPRQVLERGYSITRIKATDAVVRAAGDVQPGDTIVTELAGHNIIESRVDKSEDRSASQNGSKKDLQWLKTKKISKTMLNSLDLKAL